MNKYKIIVSEHFYSMMGSHIRFLMQISPEASQKLKNKIIEAIKSLEQMPERFPFFEAQFIPPNKYHKLSVKNWFIILFQIKNKTVYVDYIIDCRQDYKWLL